MLVVERGADFEPFSDCMDMADAAFAFASYSMASCMSGETAMFTAEMVMVIASLEAGRD